MGRPKSENKYVQLIVLVSSSYHIHKQQQQAQIKVLLELSDTIANVGRIQSMVLQTISTESLSTTHQKKRRRPSSTLERARTTQHLQQNLERSPPTPSARCGCA